MAGEAYSSGVTPLRCNTSRQIEVKILRALINQGTGGGGGGGGGSGAFVVAAGAPVAAPAVNPTIQADSVTDALYFWDGSKWVTLIAP